jgi:hypothetical protein
MSKYTSKYHQDLLEMLEIEPKLSSEKLAQIETWERANNIKLPAAVLEWYALENVENVFYQLGEDFQVGLRESAYG